LFWNVVKHNEILTLKIRIKAKPNSKLEGIKKLDENYYEVRVSVPPEKGKANERIIELLSKYYNIPKSKISIIKGNTNREKIIYIG
jgi:uncharacterized protein (TIGR00251 family)